MMTVDEALDRVEETLERPIVLALDSYGDEMRKMIADRYGLTGSRVILMLALLIMFVDTLVGRVTFVIVPIIAFVEIWMCAVGDVARKLETQHENT